MKLVTTRKALVLFVLALRFVSDEFQENKEATIGGKVFIQQKKNSVFDFCYDYY